MSVLRFIVTKQKLIEDGQPFVVANSREYLSATFDFSSAWNNCIKTAVFRKASGEAFSVLLDTENSCTVPWEVIECPQFTVSVYGVCETERITTNQVVVKVEICGYEEGKTPEDPTPTVYESIVDQLNSIEKSFENYGTASLYDVGTSAGNIPVLNDDGKLEESVLPEEIDPVFTASPAASITDENIISWNNKSSFSGSYNDLTDKPTKLSEFDNDAGYLDTETDPVFTASPAHGITDEDIEKWNSSTGFSGDYNDLTNKPTKLSEFENDEGYLNSETDPVFTASPAHGITNENIAEWDAKSTFSGDYNDLDNKPTKVSDFENDAGYLDSETDPIFSASAAHGITDEDISNWNAKSEFSGDYNDLTNKPEIPAALTDLTGTLPITQGGTGANTAAEALTNLGAAKSADVGDVSTLSTIDKTVVGAINELQAEIGDIETALSTIIGGATE